MKKVFTLAILALTMVFTTEAVAQKFSGLDKSPMDAALFPPKGKTAKTIKVIYSRPQLKGRSLSELAKPGVVWRTGANESSEITFYTDVKFGDADVKAGSYSLFTIPGDGEWTVILNSKLNEWGAYSYDESADVARIKAKVTTDGKSLEEFSIAFKEVDGGAHMVMGWDKTRVAVPIMMDAMKMKM